MSVPWGDGRPLSTTSPPSKGALAAETGPTALSISAVGAQGALPGLRPRHQCGDCDRLPAPRCDLAAAAGGGAVVASIDNSAQACDADPRRQFRGPARAGRPWLAAHTGLGSAVIASNMAPEASSLDDPVLVRRSGLSLAPLQRDSLAPASSLLPTEDARPSMRPSVELNPTKPLVCGIPCPPSEPCPGGGSNFRRHILGSLSPHATRDAVEVAPRTTVVPAPAVFVPKSLALDDVFRAAEWHGWFVAWSRNNDWLLGQDGESGYCHEFLSASDDDDTLLVVIDADQEDSPEQFMSHVRAAKGRKVAFVVVMVGLTDLGKPETREDMLSLHAYMLARGADGVVCSARTAEELAVLVELQLQSRRRSAEHLEARLDELRVELRIEYEDGLSRTRASERSASIVWQFVNRVYEDFPRLDTSLESNPKCGAKVGNYTLQEQIGKGSFGRVFSAVDVETKEKHAVKVISKGDIATGAELSALWREMRLHAKLNHKRIVVLHEVWHGPGHIFLHMELAGDSHLFSLLKSSGDRRLPLKYANQFQGEIASAVAYCHAVDVAHRDLKPENISVIQASRSLETKLLDFGQAVGTQNLRADKTGTFPFMAPEVIVACRKFPYDPVCADVWSCGVILLEMACGLHQLDHMMGWHRQTPLTAERKDELERFFSDPTKLDREVYRVLPTADQALLKLLTGVLECNPRKRWTADDMCDCEWLRNDFTRGVEDGMSCL